MKKISVKIIICTMLSVMAIFVTFGCGNTREAVSLSLPDNYFISYYDGYGKIITVARYGDEFFTKVSDASPNSYIEKVYYRSEKNWDVYLYNGERWSSYGSVESPDYVLAELLEPVINGISKINSGVAESTGEKKVVDEVGDFNGKTLTQYVDTATNNFYTVIEAYNMIYSAVEEQNILTLAEYYPSINEQTFRRYCAPARADLFTA